MTMCLLSSTDPAIIKARDTLFDSLTFRSRVVMATDARVLWRHIANRHAAQEDAERDAAIQNAARELVAMAQREAA